jgi:hypothetical protein
MFKAMAEVQQSSMNAIHHAGVSATSGLLKSIAKDSGNVMSNEVYVDHANVAMLKLSSILKTRKERRGLEALAVLNRLSQYLMRMMCPLNMLFVLQCAQRGLEAHPREPMVASQQLSLILMPIWQWLALIAQSLPTVVIMQM